MTFTELKDIINNKDLYEITTNYTDVEDDYIEGCDYTNEDDDLNDMVLFKGQHYNYRLFKNEDVYSIELFNDANELIYIKRFKIKKGSVE